MTYVRTPLSFKSKRRIELSIYNPFQRMISQSPLFHKSLRLAVHDDTVVVFFTLQTIETVKCAVGMQLARSIVNGLIHNLKSLTFVPDFILFIIH